jgi:hypothetical protein
MERRSRLLYGFATCCLTGILCASQGQALEASPSSPPTFNEKDLLSYKAKGRSTVAGQVFLSAPSGKAITQAGVSVHLIPVTRYTLYWFDRNVRTVACSSKGDAAVTENPAASRTPADCAQETMPQLLAEKRLLPYLRTTRANPTGHFWFIKIPAGRYYVVSVLEAGGGAHQEERASDIAWATIDLEAGEKVTNLVVTNCKSSLC